MAGSKLFYFEHDGFTELNETFNEMINDFGDKDQKNILVKTVREAMKPVLQMAKMRAPVDTGALTESLRIEARKPNTKDKRSRYYNPGQVVIALVTTAPGKVLAKKKWKNRKTGTKEIGIESDARANVQEFGSYKMAAHPYMRSSLESQSQQVTNNLGKNLGDAFDKYKAKRMRSKLK
jgi:HK97 gp10 family phage protein